MEDFLHCRAWGEAKLLASVDPSRWLLQHGKAGLRFFWLLLHGCLELWSSQDTARGEVVSWIDKFSCEELMILNTLIHAGVPDSRMSPEQTLCQDSALEQHCP
ncbi:hypothetical protein EJB05_35210 [Eragrostis curvula]|uniref:Uncharacterized protein n=1 Tax=Eragrostis curvula TaxID=38414 RepID=A0A5J9U750_9POAL|nr:hypothetical protein EJB05_35210 [Eragrostis curvula]